MEQIEERMNNIDEKGSKVGMLEKELRKKIDQYDDRQRSLNEQVREYNGEREEFDDLILNNKDNVKQNE